MMSHSTTGSHPTVIGLYMVSNALLTDVVGNTSIWVPSELTCDDLKKSNLKNDSDRFT